MKIIHTTIKNYKENIKIADKYEVIFNKWDSNIKCYNDWTITIFTLSYLLNTRFFDFYYCNYRNFDNRKVIEIDFKLGFIWFENYFEFWK
jgi:hypothetical protein